MYHCANADRKGAGAHLTVHHCIYELLFTALRIHHLHHHHLYSGVAELCDDLTDMGNCLRLVFLDGDGAGNAAHDFCQNGGANHHLLTFFKQCAEVGGKVRLTFAAVYDNSLAFGARRRRKLHVCGEGGTTKAHYATLTDFLNDSLVVFGNLCDKGVGGVDAFGPLISLDGNFNVRYGTACKVRARADGLYRTGNGGVDVGAHEPAGLGDHLTHFHLVSHCHAGHGRSADVLGYRDIHCRGKRQGANGAAP